MVVSILNTGDIDGVEARLGYLGFRTQRFTKTSVRDLNHESAELVYLVPDEVLGWPDWPQIRVRLAQANRYYVVVGDGLSSAAIMGAARDGAYDVVLSGDTDARWTESIQKASSAQQLWLQLYGGSPLNETDVLLGNSPSMRSLRQAIERLGPTGATVLILGESGVGKERVANALHKASGRGPFVAVNCAAIPKELMESELFGAEKGAFTGASKTREGLVEQASGGTLFLDEIGEMDVKLQPKLLRFLETRQLRRVGGSAEIRSEVRVLSATNSNLEGETRSGVFRSDLYYRLSEVILQIQPLRSRVEDIPQFALAFLRGAGERFGKHFESVEPELVRKFQGHDWPGNVRELKNAIDRMVILYDGPILRAAWWEPPRSRNAETAPSAPSPTQPAHTAAPGITAATAHAGTQPYTREGVGMGVSRKQKLQMARRLLEESGNDLTWVAAQLGIHPTTLYRWRRDKKC